MLVHKAECDHNVVLTLADLSVWCFTCDSYLDNQVDRLSPPLKLSIQVKLPLIAAILIMPILFTINHQTYE